jgi:peptide methionine sulfoxide reductase msrA/msrB
MLKWVDVIRFSGKGNLSAPKRVEKSEEEWKKLLTKDQFQVARLKGTERAFTGEYCEAHEPGLYACVCCHTPLFDSRLKFESGTGWPSFTQPVDEAVVAYHKDSGYGMVRVEVLCNVCDAHLGHVFPDGPEPSGLRYCINSASLQLV